MASWRQRAILRSHMKNIICISVVPVHTANGVSHWAASAWRHGRFIGTSTGWDKDAAVTDIVARIRTSRYL